MSVRPRLLPIVMVAATALLGVKLVDLWTGGSAAIAAASAQAADSATPAQAAPSPAPTPAPPPSAAAAPDAAPSSPAPPSPAASSGERDPLQMSAAEVGELQQLSQRRVELDRRAAEMSDREVVLQAAEKRIDEKIEKLATLEKTIESDVKQRDDVEEARVQSLANMYQQMKPTEASRILDQLDVPVVLTMLAHMRELKAAPILAAMDPAKAKAVTLALTQARGAQSDTPAPDQAAPPPQDQN
jgi:flagellar motility protein MotE (MotC chaperone)